MYFFFFVHDGLQFKFLNTGLKSIYYKTVVLEHPEQIAPPLGKVFIIRISPSVNQSVTDADKSSWKVLFLRLRRLLSYFRFSHSGMTAHNLPIKLHGD